MRPVNTREPPSRRGSVPADQFVYGPSILSLNCGAREFTLVLVFPVPIAICRISEMVRPKSPTIGYAVRYSTLIALAKPAIALQRKKFWPGWIPSSKRTMGSCNVAAQWRLDYIAAENSMGFHAPQEAARILGEAADYARQGQVEAIKAAQRIDAKKGD